MAGNKISFSEKRTEPYYLHKGWLSLIKQAANEYELNFDDYLVNEGERKIALDVRTVRRIHHQMMVDSNDPSFSIKAAKYVEPLTFDSYTLLLWTAPNVETLIQDACNFSVSIGSPIHLKLSYTLNGDAELWIINREPLNKESVVTYVGVTLFIAVFMQILYMATGQKSLGLKVGLINWPYTALDMNVFKQLMGCDIVTGSPVRKIVVPRNVLHLPVKNANKEVYAALKPVVIQQTAKIMKEDIVLQVHSILNQVENLGETTINEVAQALSFSVRTLNRRLTDAGTTYRNVLEKYKLERALYLLSVSGASVTDIAYQLGFADISTFSRAFKRWTGCSPSHIARQQCL